MPTTGYPAKGPDLILSCKPFSTAGKYCFGTAPPKIFSSKIYGIVWSSTGSKSITTSPN